jgi:hypothetical protein
VTDTRSDTITITQVTMNRFKKAATMTTLMRAFTRSGDSKSLLAPEESELADSGSGMDSISAAETEPASGAPDSTNAEGNDETSKGGPVNVNVNNNDPSSAESDASSPSKPQQIQSRRGGGGGVTGMFRAISDRKLPGLGAGLGALGIPTQMGNSYSDFASTDVQSLDMSDDCLSLHPNGGISTDASVVSAPAQAFIIDKAQDEDSSESEAADEEAHADVDLSNKTGELPSGKDSTVNNKDKDSSGTRSKEPSQGRTRRTPHGSNRRFRGAVSRTMSREKELMKDKDNEDLEATVAQVEGNSHDDGYAQLVLGEKAPEQKPDPSASASNGLNDSETSLTMENIPERPKESRGSSRRSGLNDSQVSLSSRRGGLNDSQVSLTERPRSSHGSSSRKLQSRDRIANKERPRKPGGKRPPNAGGEVSRRPTEKREPNTHTTSSSSHKNRPHPSTKTGVGDGEHRPRAVSADSVPLDSAPSTPKKSLDDQERVIGVLYPTPKKEESSTAKVADKEAPRARPNEKESPKAKESEKETSKASPNAEKRKLLQHLGKPGAKKKTGRAGITRSNSSQSFLVRTSSKNEKRELPAGDTSPTSSVRSRKIRSRHEPSSQSEKGPESLLGRLRSAVSLRQLSEHTPSALGPDYYSDTCSQSDHGYATGSRGYGSASSLDLGPAATDSATLAALTTLSWTTRAATPAAEKIFVSAYTKPKPESPLKKEDVASGMPKLDSSPKKEDPPGGKPEKAGPDATAVASGISPDRDESPKIKAGKDPKDSSRRHDSGSARPKRDGKDSSGPTSSSSKRTESSTSKSKRGGKDEDRSAQHIKKDESTSGKQRDSKTRSRPESRPRGHSVNPESRTRGTSVRAEERPKKSEPDAAGDRRRREPSTRPSKGVSEPAAAQIDSRSNNLSAGDVPTTHGLEDNLSQDSKAAEGEVVNTLAAGLPVKETSTVKATSVKPRESSTPARSPIPKSPSSRKGSVSASALPQAPLSPSKQRASRPPVDPSSPRRSPRKGTYASPRRRIGSPSTGKTSTISLQLAMALTGPPNLDEENETDPSEDDRSTGVGVAKVDANIRRYPADDLSKAETQDKSAGQDDRSTDVGVAKVDANIRRYPADDLNQMAHEAVKSKAENQDKSAEQDDRSTDVGVAKVDANIRRYPADDLNQMAHEAVKSKAENQDKSAEHAQRPETTEDVDEAPDKYAFEDWSDAADDEGVLESFGSKVANLEGSPQPRQVPDHEERVQESAVHAAFEDWSDAADEEGILESFGTKAANLAKDSQHSTVISQEHRSRESENRVEDWSDAADQSLESFGSRTPNQAASLDKDSQHSTVIIQEHRSQESVGNRVEDLPDAAGQSFGSRTLNQEESSQHSTVIGQKQRAQESVGNAAEEKPGTVLGERVPATIIPELTIHGESGAKEQNSCAFNGNAVGGEARVNDANGLSTSNVVAQENVISASFKAAEALEATVGTRETVATEVVDAQIDASTDTPLDGVANKKDEESVKAKILKYSETDESAEAAKLLSLDEHAKQMEGVSLEVEDEVPFMSMFDLVTEKSNSSILEGLEKDNFSEDIAVGTLTHRENQHQITDDSVHKIQLVKVTESSILEGFEKDNFSEGIAVGTLTHRENHQQITDDSVHKIQPVKVTEVAQNENATSSVYALLSSELAGSKARLSEARLEVNQLEKEVDLLRLRLNTLEKSRP